MSQAEAQAPAGAAGQTAAAASGYLGVTVEAGDKGGVRIVTVEPRSAADILGLRPGDILQKAYPSTYRSIFDRTAFDDVASFEAWQASTRVGGSYFFYYVPQGAKLTRSTILTTLKARGATPAAASASAAEQARTAYLTMCARGAEKLSAATCDSMRRDLDNQVAAEAAAAHEAEVMTAYRELCAPNARKVSEATCAGMLAEAKRAPATATPATAAIVQVSAPLSPPAPPKSAYDELCAAGAQVVSAETCAALKADAAR